MQYQTMLIRACYLYLGDRILAEDAVQDTFLKAYWKQAFRSGNMRKTWSLL